MTRELVGEAIRDGTGNGPVRFFVSMIRKSMPSGVDPTGAYRFSEKDHAAPKIQSAMTIQLNAVALEASFRGARRRGPVKVGP